MFLEKISGVFQRNNKKELSKSNLSLLIQKMGVLAESFSLKIEKFSFSFKLQKLLEKGIALLRNERKFSF